MKKFKYLALLLSLCCVISMFAGCGVSEFTVKNAKIKYGVYSARIVKCTFSEGFLSSQFPKERNANECSEVLEYFDGVKFTKTYREELQSNSSVWQAVVVATCANNLVVTLMVFENCTAWAEIDSGDEIHYFKADRTIDYSVFDLVRSYVYGNK